MKSVFFVLALMAALPILSEGKASPASPAFQPTVIAVR